MLNELGNSMRSLGETFLAAADDTVADKSVIGLLGMRKKIHGTVTILIYAWLTAKSASTEKISHEEVAAQVGKQLASRP